MVRIVHDFIRQTCSSIFKLAIPRLPGWALPLSVTTMRTFAEKAAQGTAATPATDTTSAAAVQPTSTPGRLPHSPLARHIRATGSPHEFVDHVLAEFPSDVPRVGSNYPETDESHECRRGDILPQEQFGVPTSDDEKGETTQYAASVIDSCKPTMTSPSRLLRGDLNSSPQLCHPDSVSSAFSNGNPPERAGQAIKVLTPMHGPLPEGFQGSPQAPSSTDIPRKADGLVRSSRPLPYATLDEPEQSHPSSSLFVEDGSRELRYRRGATPGGRAGDTRSPLGNDSDVPPGGEAKKAIRWARKGEKEAAAKEEATKERQRRAGMVLEVN